jgi:hypothetical protein
LADAMDSKSIGPWSVRVQVPPPAPACVIAAKRVLMSRIEQRIFQINEQLAELVGEEERVFEELQFHRHINDDAQRDALVSDHPEDRALARQTGADVARFERAVEEVRARRARLEEKRRKLFDKLRDL